MSVIEQESLSLDGKFTNHDVKNKVENDIPNFMEDVIDNDSDDCQDNEDSIVDNVKRDSRNLGEKNDDETQKENGSDNESNQRESHNSIEVINEVEQLNVIENNISWSVENKDENELSEQLKDSKILTEDVNDEDEEHLENKIVLKDLENENEKDKEVMSNPIELNLQDISQSNEKSIEGKETSICEENKIENEDKNQEKVSSVSDIITCEGIDYENKECNDVNIQDFNEDSDTEKECKIEKQIATTYESCEKERQEVVKSEFFMRIKKVSEINEENLLEEKSDKRKNEPTGTNLLDKANDEEVTEVKNVSLENEIQSETKEEDSEDLEKTELKLNKESNKCVENEEIIDIADEKDEECITVIDQDMCEVDKEPEKILDLEDNLVSSENTKPKTDIECNDQENVVSAESKENSENPDHSKEIKISDNLKIPLDDDVTNSQSIKQVSTPISSIKEKKPLLHISKLSNTLDILSDDEEEPSKEESQVQSTVEKQCINIEDDDDIMLIDEETSKDTNKNDITIPSGTDTKKNEKEQGPEDLKEDISMDVTNNDQDVEPESIVKEDKVTETETKDDKQDKKTEEKPSIDSTLSSKPLLPVNFLKSCKKNLAEMTREELEEFCVLKIVESVVDRSNLSEMNLQLKSMAHNIEDYKKKTNTLMKQNRDLQVVLKSVQEEQKKNSGQPITPLKITRSVGMQVLMMETSRKKSMAPNKFQNALPPNSVKSAKCQSPKTPKSQNQNNQQYPVPRLVPAVNNSNTNNKVPTPTPIAPKTQNNVPNGIKNSLPTPKPEKRSYGKMQQGNSITVDLTDDEPPSKIAQRNIAAPVRLVPQQSLLTPQRPQFANSVNTPRKVYIPISGSQNQVGQAIVLKQLSPHVPRLRGPALLPKPGTSIRMPRIAARHPAPLPDSMKQYQPPNWKALPPAPELKLSKVENGIVISWKIDGYQEENHEEIASYQLYAYQETSAPPNTALWKKIGDVKALPLPMACTLTQFMAGYKYFFAVRAVDVRSRLGPFSLPGSILLLNKM
ncbi:unnamed protein product, partial [Brenthis ino]